MAHEKSTWPVIKTGKTTNLEDSGVICELFNTGQLASLIKTRFLKVRYHNPENLIPQHMAVKENVYNETKNKCECVNRFRNDDITQHLTSVDIVEVVRTDRDFKEFYKGLSVIILILVRLKNVF